MLDHHLFGAARTWHRQLRPMVLAVFSYRYDAELVPDLLANIRPVVDGWVAFDDRRSSDLFSNEPQRRQILIRRAKELGATWVLAMDPDERVERGAATRIRGLTGERRRIIWEFNLREMFAPDGYRIDGLWGSKMQGRLFPVFDGPLCSEQALHGAWCVAQPGYCTLPAGLNLYHLKMLSPDRRRARRDLYQHLDPARCYQAAGYDYLVDEAGAQFERIPAGRDFFPAHRESGTSSLYMANVRLEANGSNGVALAARETGDGTCGYHAPKQGTRTVSQLGQLQISIGEEIRRDSKLAVVVIGLRAPRSLYDAVHSLVQQDTPSEIVVVNSGGGDASHVLGKYLRSVVLVEVREPVLVGAARNLGIQVAQAPFVAFLAGDCVAAPGWVSERINAHINGEGAVGSVVDNDKPHNPFAWAAHLMTYGHRMSGSRRESGAYGASYDRALFDTYGYFSETRVVGEDSEFHSRFRPSDPVHLHPSIRTIHSNPGGLVSFLQDQLHRGLRRRYLADFFGVRFSLGFIGLDAVSRITRALHLSVTRLNGKERVAALLSWPFLLLGTLFYLAGMAASYVKANAADRLFRRAMAETRLGRVDIAINLLRRSIDMRPVSARFHLALGELLQRERDRDEGARQLYAGWDITRASVMDVYCPEEQACSSDPSAHARSSSVGLQLVVVPDSTEDQLAEFLAALRTRRAGLGNLDVLVVDESSKASPVRARLRQSYGDFARFAPPHEVLSVLDGTDSGHRSSNRSFVVVASSACLPAPDWLDVLKCYVITYPEVALFHGSCRPYERVRAGFMERVGSDLGLFPCAADNGGLLRFGHGTNWACEKSLLCRSGGFVHEEMGVLGMLTLTERVLRAGGSSMYAPEWRTQFRLESTLPKLLRRFYQDGYYAAKHLAVTRQSKLVPDIFASGGVAGSAKAAWRFAVDGFGVWRFENPSRFIGGLVFLLLLALGLARQMGWRAGLKRSGDTSFLSQPRDAGAFK